MKSALAGLAALSMLLPLAAARAEDAPKPICADRPTKGTSPCTVDPGRWQVEIDAADWTHDRSGGVTADLGVFAATNVKYGVNDRLDLELNLTPYEVQRAAGSATVQGFGDLIARAKVGLAGGDRAVSILPFVKIPTAGAGLGNGAIEGGAVLPVALALPGAASLTLDPEIDVLKDGRGQGRHAAYDLAVGVSRPLTPALTGAVELWGADNEDPVGRLRQASFDLGLAWIPARNQDLQLDAGANFGLTRDTPALNVYLGVSRKF
ncbi:MAG: transporter [Caulobacteraceae bacterium]